MARKDELRQPLLRASVGQLGPRVVSACILAEGIADDEKEKRYKQVSYLWATMRIVLIIVL